eukprot:gene20710-23524_t
MCYILKFEDFGETPRSEVEQAIEDLCRPVMKEFHWLILEQGASHVARSMLSVLAGIPIIAERKGKNSKHQHSIAHSEPMENLVEPGLFYIAKKVSYSVPSSFHEIVLESTSSLLQLSTNELERLIADFSSSAVLGFLIRILSNPSLLSSGTGPALAQRLFSSAFGWKECPALSVVSSKGTLKDPLTEEMVPEGVSNVFYAMAGDRAGSYFLEALIECSALDFLLSVVSRSISGKCREYVEDGSGNFVLQAILRRISCELPRTHSSQMAQRLNAISTTITDELVDSEYFTHLVNFKGGVVLWLLAVVRGLPDDSYSERVGTKVIEAWIANALNEAAEDGPVKTVMSTVLALPSNPTEAEALTHKQQQLSATFSTKLIASAKGEKAAQDAISQSKPTGKGVPKGKLPVAVDPRDTTQLLVARIIGSLLKSSAPSVSQLTIRAFAHLTPESLKYVATSGAVSRAVLDVFFEVTAGTTEFKLMGISLATLGVELAGHYVGQHIVRQSFESADLRGKEKWAMTLSGAQDVLSRTKEGTASLRLVNAELYQRDPTEWRSTIKRKLKAESLLKELDAPVAVNQQTHKPKEQNKPATSEKKNAPEVVPIKAAKRAATEDAEGSDNSGGEEEEGGDNTAAKTARKRKRKRPTKPTQN